MSAAEQSELTPDERSKRYRECFSEGIQLVEQGRIGLALGAFEEAVAMAPTSSDALFNLGACHERLGDPQRAINIYRAVLELSPQDPDCYANLGTSFIKMYYREKIVQVGVVALDGAHRPDKRQRLFWYVKSIERE